MVTEEHVMLTETYRPRDWGEVVGQDALCGKLAEVEP